VRGRFVTRSEEETAALGRQLAGALTAGAVILIEGNLGAGKTAFVRGLAEGVGIDPHEVTSPTFTLMQEYRGGRLLVTHVDLYRLSPPEVEDLGLDEIVREGGLTAIEWPERLPFRIENGVSVRIEQTGPSTRTIDVDASEVLPPADRRGYSER